MCGTSTLRTAEPERGDFLSLVQESMKDAHALRNSRKIDQHLIGNENVGKADLRGKFAVAALEDNAPLSTSSSRQGHTSSSGSGSGSSSGSSSSSGSGSDSGSSTLRVTAMSSGLHMPLLEGLDDGKETTPGEQGCGRVVLRNGASVMEEIVDVLALLQKISPFNRPSNPLLSTYATDTSYAALRDAMCRAVCETLWASHKHLERSENHSFVLSSLVPTLIRCLDSKARKGGRSVDRSVSVHSCEAVLEALLSLFNGKHAGATFIETGERGELVPDSLLYSLFLQLKTPLFSTATDSFSLREDPRRLEALYKERVVQLLCIFLNTSTEQFFSVLTMSGDPRITANNICDGKGGENVSRGAAAVESGIPGQVGLGVPEGCETPLDILTTLWAVSVRALDYAPSSLVESSVFNATALLVRRLSRLLNAIGTQAEITNFGSNGGATGVDPPGADVHKVLMESIIPTLSRWETGYHHTALRESGDDLYELLTMPSSYF